MLDGLTLAIFSLIFVGKMCVFVSRPMKIVTFLRKNGETPKRVVDFPLERDTFQNISWTSSRILRVKPNFDIFISFFIIFLHLFIFSSHFFLKKKIEFFGPSREVTPLRPLFHFSPFFSSSFFPSFFFSFSFSFLKKCFSLFFFSSICVGF